MIAKLLVGKPDLLSDQLAVESEVCYVAPLVVTFIEWVLGFELPYLIVEFTTRLLSDLSAFEEGKVSLLPLKLEVV
jgi:hypothetical protein